MNGHPGVVITFNWAAPGTDGRSVSESKSWRHGSSATTWTVKQELKAQDEQANRIYYEPRCHEGDFGMAGMLINSRAEERAFAQGRGLDPATRDNSTGGAGGGEGNTDPLAGGN